MPPLTGLAKPQKVTFTQLRKSSRYVVKGNNQGRTAEGALHLSREINNVLAGWPKRGKEIQVLGPVEAPIPRLKGKYRWQILVKSKSVSLLNHFLTRVDVIARDHLKSKGVHLTLDVDPYQMV